MDDKILHQDAVEEVIDERIQHAMQVGAPGGGPIGWKNVSYFGDADRAATGLAYGGDGSQWGLGDIDDFEILAVDGDGDQPLVLPSGLWICAWRGELFGGDETTEAWFTVNVSANADEGWGGANQADCHPPRIARVSGTMFLKSVGTLRVYPASQPTELGSELTMTFMRLG